MTRMLVRLNNKLWILEHFKEVSFKLVCVQHVTWISHEVFLSTWCKSNEWQNHITGTPVPHPNCNQSLHYSYIPEKYKKTGHTVVHSSLVRPATDGLLIVPPRHRLPPSLFFLTATSLPIRQFHKFCWRFSGKVLPVFKDCRSLFYPTRFHNTWDVICILTFFVTLLSTCI